jgi:hypothetical protein
MTNEKFLTFPVLSASDRKNRRSRVRASTAGLAERDLGSVREEAKTKTSTKMRELRAARARIGRYRTVSYADLVFIVTYGAGALFIPLMAILAEREDPDQGPDSRP